VDKKTDPKIVNFLNEVNKEFKLVRVILFGSRARADYFISSDYDIILVSPDFKNFNFHERISEVYKYWNEEEDLEPLCYTPEEFEKKSRQICIVSKAIEEGIEIKL